MATDLTLSADQIERYRAELHRLFNHHSGVDALCDMALRALPCEWVPVPREPTGAMLAAADEDVGVTITEPRLYAAELYRAMLAAAPQQGQTPTGYCIINNAGEMWWDEGCVCQDASALQESADDMAESEPDAGWRVAPFYAGAARQGKAPVALTFDAFRKANVARCVKWHPEGIASWSPSDWLTAVTGELGELASLLKMRNRERDGLPGNKFSPSDKQVADEIADVLTYLDLLAEVLGVDLGAAAVSKFNEVSERVGFPDRISLAPCAVVEAATHPWQPIETAPKDGTRIIAWCVHTNAKYAKDPVAEGWCGPVVAKWIDHNGGGWTWNGLAGTFTHWTNYSDALDMKSGEQP